MATGPLSLRELVEALLAGQQVEQLAALRGKVSFAFGDEGRATDESRFIFYGIAGLHAEKLTKGFSPESSHSRPIEFTLAWVVKLSLQCLVHLGIGCEDALPINHCEKRRHYARYKLHLSWIAHECGDAPLGSGRTWGEVAGEAPTNERPSFRVNPFLLQQPVNYR